MSDTTEANVGPNSASGRMKVAECEYDEQTGDIDFIFRDGNAIKVHLSQFPQNIVHIASLRGVMESVRDTYAGSKGDVAVAREKAQGRIDQLMSGDWSKGREGTGEGQGALWVEAVANLKGWSLQDARKKLFDESKLDDAARKAIRASKAVQAEVAKIRLARAQEAVAKASQEADTGASALDSLA